MNERRVFLKTTCLGATSIIMSTWDENLKQDNLIHLYVKESNFRKVDEPSVIGFICTPSPEKIEKDLISLRKKTKYRTVFSHRSRDKYKLDFGKKIIDYFLNEPKLVFYSRIIFTKVNPKSKNLNLMYTSIYNASYERSLNEILASHKADSMHLNFNLEHKDLLAYMNKKYPNKRLKEESRTDHLHEICDFFTGTISGDSTSAFTNPTKIALSKYLKQKLKINNFSDLYSHSQNKKFVLLRTN